MSFIWPVMLLLLLLVPLFVVYYLRLQRRRRQYVAAYGTLGFAQATAGRRPLGRRRHIPPVLFLLGLTILLFALARPQSVVSLPRQEGTVILAFDVSGSMAADDMQPTRMEAAKAAAREFVQRQPRTVEIGVVAFSDSGLAVQVPTNEQETVLAAIERLSPQRGTSLGQGILAAVSALSANANQPDRLYSNLPTTPTPLDLAAGSAAIVLLTDGENNESPDPLAVAQAAGEHGIHIYTIGVGSPAGTTLHVNGFTVHTQLEEEMLQQIAQLTEGAYYRAENGQELESIYENLDLRFVVKPEKIEVTALFAGAGVLLLLLGGVFSMLWFSRVP